MIGLSLVLFLILYAWRVLAIIERQVEGLALAQLSRTKSSRPLQEGVARISPINKAEDLTFDAPPLAHSQGGFGDGDVDVFGGLHLEDTVLLAGVDGRFHAVNRTSGRTIWTMEDDLNSKPSQHLLHNLIRTDHNLQPKDAPEIEDQEIYIIEPQSGDIFMVPAASDSQEPLRRLPYSVPQLVEHSPFSFDDPNRVFVGKKETSIIEIDLDKGTMKSIMGGTDTWLISEGPDDSGDDWVRVQNGRIIQIGRTDYTIKVLSHNTLLQTLSFSTYGPNNMNKPLQTIWKRTPDDIYVQPSWDGRTYAFETLGETALWGRNFKQPIVAVFDVVLHNPGTGSDPKPIVLLQPRPRLEELFPRRAAQLEGMPAKTVVRRIGDSLFAMGHINYPLVNLAEVHPQIDDGSDSTDGKQGPGLCNDLNCYVGVRYAEREGTESRITRLLDPPRSEQPHPVQINPRDVDEQDSPPANAEQNGPIPTTTEETAIPFPSRSNNTGSKATSIIDLSSQRDNIRPKPTGAPLWTLTLPFVGGVLAIWFILRKFMHLNAPEDRQLIRPLQNSTSSRDARQPLLATPRHSHSRHSSRHVLHDDPTNGVKYSIEANRSGNASARSGEDSEILDEKFSRPLGSADVDANVTLALEEDRVGSGLGVAVDMKDGEDSDKDEGDQQDGKRKRRRGNRGKKNRRQPAGNAVTSPNQTVPAAGSTSGPASSSNSGFDSGSGGYVMVEPLASTSVKMELPMPVTTSTSSLVVGNKVLGYGSHGTIVYEGSLQGRAVAVKRLLQDFVTLASHEVSLLLQADDHPNVIRYYFSMTRDSFLYIALELCPCSLADLIETPNKHQEILGSFEPKRALQQITQGLGHLHNLKIVHRDIKPPNILVSRPKGDGQHRMLISDFGLCKKLEVDQTSFLPTMAAGGGQSLFAAGTPGWRAPEILRGDVSLDEEAIAAAGEGSNGGTGSGSGSGSSNPDRSSGTRLTKSVDIFALGCLFYYVLVSGEHPYGEKYIREVNILKGNLNLDGLEKFGEEGVEAEHLIEWMLEQDPKSRPDTEEILLHPFFWTPARRLAFLQDASDRFEIMGREPPEAGLVALETRAFDVVGADWQKRMDKVFLENLGKYRKYQPGSVQDLLRALRNKKNHYQDLPENVKRHLGPLPDGFLSYFTRRFPALFLHVYSVISDLPLRHEPMFRTYFELEH